MNGQINVFEFLPPEQQIKPGDWVEENKLGEELTFEEITRNVGNMIIIDTPTINHAWYKAVRVESIHIYNNGERRLIYYDGGRQRGLVDEHYFDNKSQKAWKIKG